MEIILNSDNCNICVKTNECQYNTRLEFIDNCLPFLNLPNSKINIINWLNNNYIYYEQNNKTYKFTNDFKLNLYTELLPKFSDYKLSNFEEDLKNNVIFEVDNGEYSPIYYLFINKNNCVFNLFITTYLTIFPEKKTCLSLIFNKEDKNKFVALSSKFDIFNIGLTCNKFFNLYLFFEDDYNQEYIKEELEDLFKDYNFIYLYTLINNYKFIINSISKEEKENFILSKVKENNINLIRKGKKNTNDIKKTKEILNIENNTYINKTNDEILLELASSIVEYRIVIKELEKLIPNFSMIFFMSILSYRLKEKLLRNTWAFDSAFIFSFIKDNTKKNFDYKTYNKKRVKINKIESVNMDKLYILQKPPIYEYGIVRINNIEYGNCMENILLQFLKILFYNPQKENYDNNYINLIIKENVKEKILDIFKNINNEKLTDFDHDWINFILELPNINNFINGNYQFIKQNYELDANLYNLITFFKYLTIINFENMNEETYLNNLIKRINNKYNIIIKNLNNNQTIIYINCYNNYTLNLINQTHAYFENSIIDKKTGTLHNILESITIYFNNFNEYLRQKEYITLSNLDSYICFDYLSNPNLFYQNYISTLPIDNIYNSYLMLFFDNVYTHLPKDTIFLLLNENITPYLMYNNNSKMLLLTMLKKIKVNEFWKKFINIKVNNKIIFEGWDNEIWEVAIDRINENFFIEKIINEKIYLYWSDTIWKKVIMNGLNEEFIKKIIEDEIYKFWSLPVLSGAMMYINNEDFWLIYENTKLYTTLGIEQWITAFIYIKYNKFWENIVNNKNYKWSEEIWIEAMKKLKNDYFWKQITDNQEYNNWSNNLWLEAIKYMNENRVYFWKQIINKELYVSWNEEYWLQAFTYLKYYFFWQPITNNEIYSLWTDNIWFNAFKFLHNDYFWEVITNKELYLNWNNEYWILSINITNKYFWENIKYEKFIPQFGKLFLSEFIFNLLIYATKKYYFWINILNINNYFDINNSVWNIVIFKVEEIIFWKEVLKNKLYQNWSNENWIKIFSINENRSKVILDDQNVLLSWNNEIWIDFFKYYKFYNKNISEFSVNWSDKEWYLAFLNIKNEKFWIDILTLKIYNSWNNETWYNYFNLSYNFLTITNEFIKNRIKSNNNFKKIELNHINVKIIFLPISINNINYTELNNYDLVNIIFKNFWLYVFENKKYQFYDLDLNSFLQKFNLNEFYNQNELKKKYLKYKLKYLKLKKKF